MRTLKATGIALLTGVGLSLNAAHADPPMDDDDAPSAELREHHRHHQHGGITQFIEMSLDTLGEDEAKRPQVEKIQGELHACMEPMEESEKAVLLTIADGVAAGAVDGAKVNAGIAQLTAAGGGIHDCVWKSLNELHAVLSPVERASLVDKVEAHWAVWKHVNHEAAPGGREKGGRLAELARELGLTPAQLDKMAPALKTALVSLEGKFDPEPVRASVGAFGKAFISDAFDAQPVTSNTTSALTTHGTQRMALFYETLTPLLTPEQRVTLASHLRQHASHHPAVSAP